MGTSKFKGVIKKTDHGLSLKSVVTLVMTLLVQNTLTNTMPN